MFIFWGTAGLLLHPFMGGMMKRTLGLLSTLLLVAPAAAGAQVEIGLDGGLVYEAYSDLETDFGTVEYDNQTNLTFPASWFRLGFVTSEQMTVETLMALNRISEDDGSFTTIVLVPGVNFAVGEGGLYLRGEAGLQRISYNPDQGEGDSQTQFTLGAAAGLRKALQGTPVAFRLEGGVGRWFEKSDDGIPAITRIRILVGISAALN